MEVYADRAEIRRRMLSRMGFVTGDSQAGLTTHQFNEFIRSAALEIYSRCPWVAAQRETFIDIGIDQRFVNYPDNATAGNIIQIGVWDAAASRYVALRRARIQITKDDEPLVEEGEPASVTNRGRPIQYEPKAQIELWPRADQAYALKIDHTVSPDLGGDGVVSVVDAECIVLWACADAFDFQGDGKLADNARAKCDKRIGKLRHAQHTKEPIKRGRLSRLVANGATIVDDQVVMPGGDLPNSGTYPSVMPVG